VAGLDRQVEPTAHRPQHPHIVWRRQSSVPDHWYFCFADAEWGPAFIKVCSYAPYPVWCRANGHEWAKRQLAKAGVGFEALDNALRMVDDPATAHGICERLAAGDVRVLLDRMTAVMPDPLTAVDRHAGFEWAFSVAQMEMSDTAVFDQPRQGTEINARSLAELGDGNVEPACLEQVVLPSVHDGRRAPGLRFGDPPHYHPARFGRRVRARHRWPHQQIAPRPDAEPVEPELHVRAGVLRPAPPPPQRLHRTHPGHQHLQGHQPWATRRRLPHPTRHPRHDPHPDRPRRARQAETTSSHPTTHHRLARIRNRTQPPPTHPPSRMTTTPKLASTTNENCLKVR
jgi:hypothetical protein